jgi:hypothetical protein
MEDLALENGDRVLEEAEEAPSLVDLLKDQARLRKLIDPDGLFTSVSTASSAQDWMDSDSPQLFVLVENIQGLSRTGVKVGRVAVEGRGRWPPGGRTSSPRPFPASVTKLISPSSLVP